MIAETEKFHTPATRQADRPVVKTVLIIEDDVAFRDLLALHIAAAGYKVLMNVTQDISQLVRRMNTQYVDMAGYVFGRTKR